MEKEFVKAKDYAYRLLAYRPRSIKEIQTRLESRGYSQQIIEKVIDYLKELNYLNDEEFACEWVNSIMQTRPVGQRMLRFKLRQKGIADEIIKKVVDDVREKFPEENLVKEIVSRRRRMLAGVSPLKRKRRIYDYLKRRGFSSDVILAAINEKDKLS